jgi:hypothetical protein
MADSMQWSHELAVAWTSGAPFTGRPPDAFIREKILKPLTKAIPINKVMRGHHVAKVYYNKPIGGDAEIMLDVTPVEIPDFKWVQLPTQHDNTWRLRVDWHDYPESLEVRLYTTPSSSICATVKVPEQAQMGFAVDMKTPPLPDGFIDELVTWLEGA